MIALVPASIARRRPLAALLALVLVAIAPAAEANRKVRGKDRVERTGGKGGEPARRLRSQRPARASGDQKVRSKTTLGESRRRQKFDRVRGLEPALRDMRRQVDRDLEKAGVSFDRALAAIVRIMDTGYVRLGSHKFADPAEVAKKKHGIATYGAISLRKDQVEVVGDIVKFDFIGKAHRVSKDKVEPVRWQFELRDPALARAIEAFKAQKGDAPELFAVPSSRGRMQTVSEQRVRAALGRYGALPKDLRTFHANRIVRDELSRKKPARTADGRRKQIDRAIEVAARALHHDEGTSKQYYVEKEMLDRFERDGTLGARGPP